MNNSVKTKTRNNTLYFHTRFGSVRIFISSSADSLRKKLAEFVSTATVEAEFGDDVVTGSVLTLAHHGERSSRPCPCSLPNFPELGIQAIGVSHIDLDTIGGILAILGIKPEAFDWVRDFWKVAAGVDVAGVHKLSKINTGYHAPRVLEALNAFYAFSENNRVFAPRDGAVEELDLTPFVETIIHLLCGEFVEDEFGGGRFTAEVVDEDGDVDWVRGELKDFNEKAGLVEAGKTWAEAKETLKKESWDDSLRLKWGTVTRREAESFVNHLYDDTDISVVVGYNPANGTVTVSVADPHPAFNCRDIVQELWGPEAGGHAGIAGSPRGKVMTYADACAAYEKCCEILRSLK